MTPRMGWVAGLWLAAVMAAAMVVGPAPAVAVEPSEVLSDPALEARAREISKGLRCLVCQNQSIDDSNADLARDLRVIVRERLTAGDSDVEVVKYVVARYGDFVLLKPPLKITTFVLWFGPAAVALFGLVAMVAFFRRRARGGDAARPQALSEDEKRRVRDLLDGDGP